MSDSATVRSVPAPRASYIGRVKGAILPLRRLLAMSRPAPAKNQVLQTRPQSISKPPVRATRPEVLKCDSVQNPELAQMLSQEAVPAEEPSVLATEERSSEVRVVRRKSSLVKLSRVEKMSKRLAIVSFFRRLGRSLVHVEPPRHHSISLSRASLIRRRKRRDLWISLAVAVGTIVVLLLRG